jgi:hypothetical protein
VAPQGPVPDTAPTDEASAPVLPPAGPPTQPVSEEPAAPPALDEEPPADEQEIEAGTKRGSTSSIWIRLTGIVLGIVGVFLVFMAMIIVRAYVSKPSDELVGKWEMVGTEDRAQFSADGTAILTKGGGQSYGRWTRQPNGRLKIEGRTLGSSWGDEYQVNINGDDLTLKKLDGLETKYKRVAIWTKKD